MLKVEFTKEAEKALSDFEKSIAQRILKKIRWLAENYEQINHIPLKGQFEGVYKLRVGSYRIMYIIREGAPKILSILLVGHRREIYK